MNRSRMRGASAAGTPAGNARITRIVRVQSSEPQALNRFDTPYSAANRKQVRVQYAIFCFITDMVIIRCRTVVPVLQAVIKQPAQKSQKTGCTGKPFSMQNYLSRYRNHRTSDILDDGIFASGMKGL